jgi:uncharacterized OsmC-like protein
MTTINGVDTGRLSDTVSAITADPSLGTFQFRLDNSWEGGGYNRSYVSDFAGAGGTHSHEEPFELANGEHAVLLGGDEAANPVEQALHALAGCLTTSLVYHAAARGITIRSVRSRLEGDLDLQGFLGLDPSVRNGYQNISVAFDVDADADDAQIDELIEIAQQRSPVFDIVSNPVPVKVRRLD